PPAALGRARARAARPGKPATPLRKTASLQVACPWWSAHGQAAADTDGLAGDVGSLIADQEHRSRRDFFGAAGTAQRNGAHHGVADLAAELVVGDQVFPEA